MKKSDQINFSFVLTLTLCFVTLKIFGLVHWSWLWILCPIWIPACFFATILLGCMVYVAVKMIRE